MAHIAIATCVHHPLDARIHARQIEALLRAGHEISYAAPFSATGTFPDYRLHCHDVPRAVGLDRGEAVAMTIDWIRAVQSYADVILVHDIELARKLGRIRTRAAKVWDVHENNPAAISARPYLPDALRSTVRKMVTRWEAKAEQSLHLILAETSYQERFTKPHPLVLNLPWVSESEGPAADEDIERQVIYVGSITQARGIDEMEQLASLLVGDDIDVALVGPADDEAALENLEEPPINLLWQSRLPNPEALAKVRTSVAGLSLLQNTPNFAGSMPTKVLEYLAQGTPVITTELPLAAEVVRKFNAGYVVPFGDVRAAAQAARELANNPALRREMGERGRAGVLAEYNWNTESQRFVHLIEEWAAQPALNR